MYDRKGWMSTQTERERERERERRNRGSLHLHLSLTFSVVCLYALSENPFHNPLQKRKHGKPTLLFVQSKQKMKKKASLATPSSPFSKFNFLTLSIYIHNRKLNFQFIYHFSLMGNYGSSLTNLKMFISTLEIHY